MKLCSKLVLILMLIVWLNMCNW